MIGWESVKMKMIDMCMATVIPNDFERAAAWSMFVRPLILSAPEGPVPPPTIVFVGLPQAFPSPLPLSLHSP